MFQIAKMMHACLFDASHNYLSLVYQFLAHGRWLSPGTPASSSTKTGRHNIAEILLKVALNTKNQSINHSAKRKIICNVLYICV
jgi:hypothetical protein